MHQLLRAARLILLSGRQLPADIAAKLYGLGVDVDRLETQYAK